MTQLVQEIAKFKVGPNKPIIGSNTFRFQILFRKIYYMYYMLTKAVEHGEEGTLPFKAELIGRKNLWYLRVVGDP